MDLVKENIVLGQRISSMEESSRRTSVILGGVLAHAALSLVTPPPSSQTSILSRIQDRLRRGVQAFQQGLL
jgi:hypothetical protein